MNETTDRSTSTTTNASPLAAAARSQAPWAAIAAVTMLYFGFTMAFVDDLGAQVVGYTLRGGGVAMALSAAFLATGKPFSLLFDGVVAMLIGIGLAVGGVMWFVEIRTVDFQGILEIVFGYIFFTSGKRSFSDYARVCPLFVEDSAEIDPTPHPVSTRVEPAPQPPALDPLPQRPEAEPASPPPEGYLSSFADDKPDDASPCA